MADWSKFNIDVAGINKSVTELENNSSNFEELPDGKYEVALNNIELKESKSGHPMLAASFEVCAGEYTGRYIFMNQLVIYGDHNDSFRVHTCNMLLRSLNSPYSNNVSFAGGLPAYEQLVNAINAACQDEEYLLSLGTNKGGYRTYKILEHFVGEAPQYTSGAPKQNIPVMPQYAGMPRSQTSNAPVITYPATAPVMPMPSAPLPPVMPLPANAPLPTPAPVMPTAAPVASQQRTRRKQEQEPMPAGAQNDSDIPF